LIAALSVMRSEPKWTGLDDDGASLVLSPSGPFLVLWATKRWTQLTGYLVNDVLGAFPPLSLCVVPCLMMVMRTVMMMSMSHDSVLIIFHPLHYSSSSSSLSSSYYY
jgi:hypothetical protein